jgi:hypothetical protein
MGVREAVVGKGGEMTQTLYAHMNKIKIKKKCHQAIHTSRNISEMQ